MKSTHLKTVLRQIAPNATLQHAALGLLMALCCLGFSGCIYDAPITANPTRKIEEKLLGNWVSKDGKEKLKVCKLDDSVYIVSANGLLFRAYHSDLANTPFVSLQDIEGARRKYAFVTWKLSEDGKRLNLRAVSTKLVPENVKDSAAIQKILQENLTNEALLGEEELEYTKEK